MGISVSHAALVGVAQQLDTLGATASGLTVAGRGPRWAELIVGARALDSAATRIEGLGASLGASRLDDLTLGAAFHARAGAAEIGTALARPLEDAHPHLRNQLTQMLDSRYPVDMYGATGAFEGMVKRFDPSALRAMSDALTDSARTSLNRATADASDGVALATRQARSSAPDPGGFAHRPRI